MGGCEDVIESSRGDVDVDVDDAYLYTHTHTRPRRRVRGGPHVDTSAERGRGLWRLLSLAAVIACEDYTLTLPYRTACTRTHTPTEASNHSLLSTQ